MNALIPQHSPTPEFRDSLERELLRTLRDVSRELPPSLRWLRRPGLRTAATLALGLVLGIGSQFASAQVQESRQKLEYERVKETERQVAAMRLMLARATADEQGKAIEAGLADQQEMVKALAAARAAELEVARLDLDLAEVRATAAMPRDELWAPLVGDRDFVKERLRLRAAAAQAALAQSEAVALAFDRRSQAAGSYEIALHKQVQERLAESRVEFNRLALKLQLRDQFLSERLSPEEVTRRTERFEVMNQAQRVQELLRVAEFRLEVLRKRHAAGGATLLALRRAELEVLERQAEMQHLQVRMKAIGEP